MKRDDVDDPIAVSDALKMPALLRQAGAAATLTWRGAEVVLDSDLAAVTGVIQVPPFSEAREPTLPLEISSPTAEPKGSAGKEWLALPDGSYLIPGPPNSPAPPALGPIVRVLVERGKRSRNGDTESLSETPLPGGWRLRGGDTTLHKEASDLAARSSEWAGLADRDFANSAPYMGTKRALLPFIMTALGDLEPAPLALVDLMCGSGIVSGGSSRRWRTISSDSQAFCRALAVVQGGGFTRERSADILRRIREPMSDNLSSLSALVDSLLLEEAQLLSAASDWSSLASKYAEFVERTPGFPDGIAPTGSWDPVTEVRRRQAFGATATPYCLLTAYFANVYFGIRQAVELDSLRYGIDQLDDACEREWALGALVVTASAVATTYGGHFAQPPAPPKRLANPATARRVLTRRHLSATREFEIRLVSLSKQSEQIPQIVESVPGPWSNALETVVTMVDPAQSVVYLDAPYRRDEYSRYYHVLETLVTYNYPSAVSSARLPEKGVERFSSEFFTRSREAMTESLSRVVGSILNSGFRCAWSYADRADANPLDVLRAVGPMANVVRSYACDHAFKRQGQAGRRASTADPEAAQIRGVREYLFVIEPRTT